MAIAAREEWCLPALGELKLHEPLRPAHDRNLGNLPWGPCGTSPHCPRPQPAEPMSPSKDYNVDCGRFDSPWAVVPQPP